MKRTSFVLMAITVVFSTVISILTNTGLTSAMSGNGTSGSPYQVTTCADLQNISSNTSAYYALANDIDCSASSTWNSGAGFLPIDGFSGTLDGQSHTISGFTISRSGSPNVALFGYNATGTIKNLTFVNASVTGSSYVGVVVGLNLSGTVIDNVAVSGVVTAVSNAGLLAGSLQSGSSVSQTAVSGTLAASGSYAGGMVGVLRDSSIANSYANVTMTGSTNTIAGFAGAVFTNSGSASITNSYSAGSIASTVNQSGFAGETATNGSTITFSNDFSVTSLSSTGNRGAMIGALDSGTTQMTFSRIYFDATAAHSTTCDNATTISGCTAVNTTATDGSHFYNNTTAAPLSSWDFTNVWAQTTGLPTLKNAVIPSVPGTPTALSATIPTGVTVAEMGSPVLLAWTAPTSNGNSAITDYSIQYQVQGAGSWTTLTHGVSATTSLLFSGVPSGLVYGTTYIFRVAAINAVGTGAYVTSSPFPFITTPNSPTNLQAVPANQQVTLSWNAPVDNGSSITDYSIQYENIQSGVWNVWNHTPSMGTSIVVTGLTNGQWYNFQVAGINSAGTGKVAQASSILVATVPSALNNVSVSVVGPTATLGWAAPTNDGGSMVAAYNVYYRVSGSGNWTQVSLVNGSLNWLPGSPPPTGYSLGGLVPGQKYDYMVAAANNVGQGATVGGTFITPSTATSVSTKTPAGTSTPASTATAPAEQSVHEPLSLEDYANYANGKDQQMNLFPQQVVYFAVEHDGTTEQHTVTISGLQDNFIIVTIHSAPQDLRIDRGQSKTVTIEGRPVMQISYFGRNADGTANVVFKRLATAVVAQNTKKAPSPNSNMLGFGIAAAVVILSAVLLMAKLRRRT